MSTPLLRSVSSQVRSVLYSLRPEKLLLLEFPPGGSGWIIGVWYLGNSATAAGCSDREVTVGASYSFPSVLISFVLALLLSIFTSLFLPSSISLSYFILAVPMLDCF